LRRILTALALAMPTATWAVEEVPSTPPPVKEIPAFGLLPDGSELKNVILPRYDENRRLVSVVSAKAMTIVGAGEIAGDAVTVLFYNSDQTQRARVDFSNAVFNQQKGQLTTKDPVHMQSDRMSTRGGGLYYSLAQSKGFMLGPVTTNIQAPPTETTMHAPKSPLRTTALLGISLVTQSLVAAPPKPLTTDEAAAIQADAASKAAAASAAQALARKNLDSDAADAATVSKDVSTFLTQADLPAADSEPVPAPAKPLEIQSGPNDTLIHCEGGMYYDADEGVMVYLKNVTVKDPRFNLSGANELKIFFEKKPAKATKDDSQEPPKSPAPDTAPEAAGKAKPGGQGSPGAGFGEVERIVATGAVLIEQKAAPGKDPIHASGAIFTYNVKADQIILSGGYPWYTQGTTFMRAKEPNLTIRMSPKTGSFVTEGVWDMGGNLESKKK
jgi:lipopolysaccharide export system protein LptA